MLAPRLSLALCLLLSAGQSYGEKVDLSGQFPDDASRNQREIGACHVFASIALLEAAIYRRHGTRIMLSEADLFARNIVANSSYFLRMKDYLDGDPDVKSAMRYIEGQLPELDFAFALQHGIATADTVSWAELQQRYKTYKNNQQRIIARKLEACDLPDKPRALSKSIEIAPVQIQISSDILQQVSKDFYVLGEDQKRGYTDVIGAMRSFRLQQVQNKAQGMKLEAEAVLSLSKYLELAAGQKTKAAEEFLLGDDPRIEKERNQVLGLLRGFHQDITQFREADEFKTIPDSTKCRSMGQLQKQLILSRLRQGVPILLQMDLRGLWEWSWDEGIRNVRAQLKLKKKPLPGKWHAFVVSGFEMTGPKGDLLILKTRNSWGGKNPDVSEDRLCRVDAVIALLTDTEK